MNKNKILTFEEMTSLRHDAYNAAIKRRTELEFGSTERKEIDLLVNQYDYGIAAQEELAMKCLEYGWLKLPT